MEYLEVKLQTSLKFSVYFTRFVDLETMKEEEKKNGRIATEEEELCIYIPDNEKMPYISASPRNIYTVLNKMLTECEYKKAKEKDTRERKKCKEMPNQLSTNCQLGNPL